MEQPRSGFLIVSRFEELYDDYLARFETLYRDYWSFTGELIYSLPQRRLAANEVRKKYRGIDRMPLIAWPANFRMRHGLEEKNQRPVKRLTIWKSRTEVKTTLSFRLWIRATSIPYFAIRRDGK